MHSRGLELLAPARDAETARQAILHGADAIYIGGPSHGARASAANSIADIAELTDYAHIYGVKVYVTLNTIIYDDELDQVQNNIRQLHNAGVDALIVQDMSLLRMDIPPIDLHASTQCDIRTREKAKFLSSVGFSQLVLPREFSLEQIRQVREAVDPAVKLEAFVHGALCVSYSGDCQASCLANGRSANRGECAQMCRLPYSLTDADGHVIMRDKHLLSLRDLNRLADIEALADAGISSFKIEGRLKDAAYVKQTVAAYRRAIDRVIQSNPDKYYRTSFGTSHLTFSADVNKAFNRGFTSYFLNGRPAHNISMANINTPKWVGEQVGTVKANKGNVIIADLNTTLNNGDGLGYFTPNGDFTGFRLNRAEGNRLFPASATDIKPGTTIYRNRDVRADAVMSQKTAERTIAIDMDLSIDNGTLTLTATAEQGVSITTETKVTADVARTPQTEARRRALSKLGGTPFTLRVLNDTIPADTFIPASSLTSLRQQAISDLKDTILTKYTRVKRQPEHASEPLPYTTLSYHDNVANRLAEQFYRDHGATEIERAIETQKDASKRDITVMTTRYCLRRELGACLRTPDGSKLPSPLYLSNKAATYRLDFDCAACQMHLTTKK